MFKLGKRAKPAKRADDRATSTEAVIDADFLERRKLFTEGEEAIEAVIYRRDGRLAYTGKVSQEGLMSLARDLPHGANLCVIYLTSMYSRRLSFQVGYVPGLIDRQEMENSADVILTGQLAYRVQRNQPLVIPQEAVGRLLFA